MSPGRAAGKMGSDTPFSGNRDAICKHTERLDTTTEKLRRDEFERNSESSVPEATDGCSACKTERRKARRYRWKVIASLIMPFTLQAFDITIIASALPWIANDFGQLSQSNWIISAFNLTSAAFIPFWGQMADIFGRHASIQATLLTMIFGSALCTGSPSTTFPVLLLGRALQGVGCAGIVVVVRVILSDKVSLEENAKTWSLLSLTGGVSYAIGPAIGGYLTTSSWRWCFAINIPMCLAAVLIVLAVLRPELLGPRELPNLEQATNPSRSVRVSRRIMTIDVGGQGLFLVGFILLTLGLTWGGVTLAWDDAIVLLAIIVGSIVIGVFFSWEYLMAPGRFLALRWPHRQPMIPWELISNREIALLFYITFATGAAMYAVLYFCDVYFTVVMQETASYSGVRLLLYTPGLAIGVWLATFMCNFYPKKTFVPILLGSIVEATGIGIIALALYCEEQSFILGMMALTGVGTGMRLMPVPLHGVGFFPPNNAAVISLMAVAQPLGGTIASTVMFTVFNNLAGLEGDGGRNSDFTAISNLTEPLRSEAMHKAKIGIVWAYVSIVPLMVLCIIAALFLGNVDITQQKNDGSGVRRGVYLLHLLRRRSPKPKDANRDLRPQTRREPLC